MSIYISKICPSKGAWKYGVYINTWNTAADEGRPWRYWKIPGMKVLIKHFKESGLAPETMLRTQRSRRFPKPEKSVTFGILAKEGPHESILESWNFRNGWKCHIWCKLRRWSRWCNGKVAVSTICWVMSILMSKFCPWKWAWKTRAYRNIWNAAAGQRQPWHHSKVLGVKVLIKQLKGSSLAPETMLCSQRSPRIPKAEKSVIFGTLAKGGTHEKFLESWNFLNGIKRHILCKQRHWSQWCNGKVADSIISWVISIYISKTCPPKWA